MNTPVPQNQVLQCKANCVIAVAALVAWILAGVLWILLTPNFREVTVAFPREEPKQIYWPFVIKNDETGIVEVQIDLSLRWFHPTMFTIFGSGTVRAVEVNGNSVYLPELPRALNHQDPLQLRLWSNLRVGKNILKLTVEKNAPTLAIRPSVSLLDPINLIVLVAILSALSLTFLFFYRINPDFLHPAVALIIFAGIALRIIYVFGTPYYVRSHDVGGHIEYIKYVAERLHIPPSNYGWETHQPPLYYIFCGLLTRLVGQENSSWTYFQWQLVALILSAATLLICIPISRLLFNNGSGVPQMLFLLIVSVFPGLLFVSARINNDALYTLVSLLWFLLLLKAWKNKTILNWISLFVLLGIGMLVKNGTLVLIAITIICLMLCSGILWRTKIAYLGALALSILLISGWYQIPKLISAHDPVTYLVATKYKVNHLLEIPRSLVNMLTFDPVQVVAIPFNNSWIDASRRMYFLEYFFKSSLFGEWTWGSHLLPLARIVVISGILGLVLAAIGLWHRWRQNDFFLWPTVLTAAALITSQAVMLWQRPLACSQDFRFHVLFLVPVCYWAVRGSEALGKAGIAICGIFILNVVIFEILLLAV